MKKFDKCMLCQNIGKELTLTKELIEKEKDNFCADHKLQLFSLMLYDVIWNMGLSQVANR